MTVAEKSAPDAVPERVDVRGVPLTPQAEKLVNHPEARLGGHVLDPGWLPDNFTSDLAEKRVEHHRLLHAAHVELDVLRELQDRWVAEDREREEALVSAARTAAQPPADERTSSADRQLAERPHVEALSAVLVVIGEFVNDTIQHVRREEPRMLAGLKADFQKCADDHREAERLVEQAKARGFRDHRLAAWVKATADDYLGGQPAPALAPCPPQVHVTDASFERRWHERRDWADKGKAA